MNDIQGSYDVIIVGGGPAGLAVGSELSKVLKVLVIDKSELTDTRKAWFVPKDVVEKNPDIEPYTFGGVTRFLASTYSGGIACWKAKLFDRYPYINPNLKILDYWKSMIRNNGSELLSQCFYEDHLVANDRVSLKTSRGTTEAMLLIDASGYNSPILKKYEITHNSYYWWSVYGAVAKHPGGIKKPLEVGDYMLWQTFEDTNLDKTASLRSGRPVFEYEIYDENTSLSLVLWLTRERVETDFMKEVYQHIIRKEKSTEAFHDIEIQDWRYGWYPSGGLTMKVARDNVAFIGDAGSWCTPCGWGMGFILNNYKGYAENLVRNIKENKLDRHSLENLVSLPTYDKYETLLNQFATHFLSNATAGQLDKFIKLFNPNSPVHVDPIICEKMFTLKITRDELKTCIDAILKTFELEELIKILPKKDYLDFIEIGDLSVKQALQDNICRLFHHGKGPKRPLGDGYAF